MALKDWTKVIDRSNKIEFIKKNKIGYSSFIQIYFIPKNYFGRKNNEYFQLNIYDGISIKYKEFKTKSAALKYAKAYMRKH